MSTTIIVNIEVDTQKLLQDYPQGGNISTHDIIVMTDGQKDSYYENGYKDKLVSMVSPSDTITWRMTAKDNSDFLRLLDYEGDINMLNVLDQKPSLKRRSHEWDGNVKSDASPNESTNYTYSFIMTNNIGITWSWDPQIKIRPLP